MVDSVSNNSEEIVDYYNKLASEYDEDRFSNTYGNYIHNQEIKVLNKYLDTTKIDKNLDVATGTGRFLDFAHYGFDISEEMVKVARKKFPNKNVVLGDAKKLPFADNSFKNVLSFHLFMHLNLKQTREILLEVNRILEKGGRFIFDIPSQKRRELTSYKTNSWHGANQIKVNKLKEMIAEKWELVNYHGIAFFPIHKIPKKIRQTFIGIDNIMAGSPLRELSSHLIFILEKK